MKYVELSVITNPKSSKSRKYAFFFKPRNEIIRTTTAKYDLELLLKLIPMTYKTTPK